MFRKHPDAVALVIFGLVLLFVNIPRLALQHARWDITPIKAELKMNHDQVRQMQEQIKSQQEEIRAAAEEVRRAIHE